MTAAQRTAGLALLGVLAAVGVALIAFSPKAEDLTGGPTAPQARQSTVDRMVAHLERLQRIAREHGGNRAAGTAGERASATYVAGRLRAYGYRVRRQRLRIAAKDASGRRTTSNVIADLPGRATGPVVMAGAHLDSVPEGPGINDNGSGVAALLEAARSLAQQEAVPRRRRLRLAFWGGEEAGLLGSRHYVRRLAPGRARRITAYLNLDMVGSRNGGRFLYVGGKGKRPAGVARRVLRRAGVALRKVDIRGASDHAPFDDAGVPVFGLFSGASAVKTPGQQELWGGRADKPFDRCYHLACDRLDGVSRTAMGELGRGAAETLRALLLSRPGWVWHEDARTVNVPVRGGDQQRSVG